MRLRGKTFALVAPVQPIFHGVSYSNETTQNAPKHNETHQNLSLGSNGMDRCIRCDKFRCDFVARTFALVALVQPVLYRASCSNKTIQNASKHNKTHQNMSLGPNGVDRVHSLRKIPMRPRGKNFCINCTSSARFALSFVQYEIIQNATKHYETQQNMSLGSNGVDRFRSLRKILMRLRETNFCISWTSSAHFISSIV